MGSPDRSMPVDSSFLLGIILILLAVLGILTTQGMASKMLLGVDYEVWGRVQGVFFRKFTHEKALSLGLKGWVKNTRDGTVKGQMEGSDSDVAAMKTWLEKTGSPQSRIDKAVFTNERQIDEYSF